MVEKIKKNFPIILIVGLWFLFICPVFLGKTTFPSTYQANFYSPWNTLKEFAGPVKNNAQPDIITQIYPWKYFTVSELKSGRIPFWNPYSFAGTPHLANYQSAVLFPLNIFYLLPLEFIDIWTAVVVLQPLLAAFFMYFFVRSLKVSKEGSLISAFSFMFCGFITTWLGYATLGYAILFLPLSLYLVEKYRSTGKNLFLLLFAFTFPLSFFAGHFQTSIYFAAAIMIYIIYGLLLNSDKRSYLLTSFFYFVGILLTMPQVLPSIEFYNFSVRSELFQKVEVIPFQYLITLFSPDFFGNPVTRNDWFGHYAEWNGYAGLIPLSLGILTLLFKRAKTTYLFISLAILSLLISFETPIQTFIISLKIPVLSTSSASRAIVIFSFSVAVLAGFGFDTLKKHITKTKKIVIWLSTVIILFGTVSAIGLLEIKEAERLITARNNSVLPILLLLILVLTLVVRLFKRKLVVVLILAVIILASGFEMLRFAGKWQNFDSKKIAFAKTEVTDFYNSVNKYDRFIGLSGGEDSVYYKVPALGGYDPLYKEEYGELVQYITEAKKIAPERSVVNFPLKGVHTDDALNFLGVKYVLHKKSDGTFPWAFPFSEYPEDRFMKVYEDESFEVFENKLVFPRAYFVSKVVSADKDKILDLMFDSNLREIGYLENVDGNKDYAKNSKAEIVDFLPGKVKINSETNGESFLVFTENYYPGWSARINGEAKEVFKVDYSFLGVEVPPGKNVIEFVFRPTSFYIGVYLFLSGILCMVIYISNDFIRKIK